MSESSKKYSSCIMLPYEQELVYEAVDQVESIYARTDDTVNDRHVSADDDYVSYLGAHLALQ